MELGKQEWAYWDLMLAAEIEPGNWEISKKLEEVNNFINTKKAKNQAQSHCPKGLGLGLPPFPKKTIDNLTKDLITPEETREMNLFIGEKEDKGVHLETMSQDNEKENPYIMEIIKPEGSLIDGEDKSTNVFREKEIADNKDVRMEDTRTSHSSYELSSTITNEDVSSVCFDKEFKTPSLEFTHRFHNRNKRGSKLTISKSNYHLMTKGKTLMFYNAKSGSFMEVKIAHMLDEKITRNSDDHSQGKVRNMQCDTLSSLNEVKQDNTKLEVYSEVESCMTYEDGHHICEKDSHLTEDDCATSCTTMPSQFHFSTNPKCKARRKSYDIKTFSGNSEKIGRRRKMPKVKNAPLFSTNFDCRCRYEVGKKRKFSHLLSMKFHFPSRKKLAPHDHWSDKSVLIPLYCNNACKIDSTSSKFVVSSCNRVKSCAGLVQICPNIRLGSCVDLCCRSGMSAHSLAVKARKSLN